MTYNFFNYFREHYCESLSELSRFLINFCLQNIEYVIEDEGCSLEVIVYALFILKEISSNNHLDLILEIAKLDEEILDLWFGYFYT